MKRLFRWLVRIFSALALLAFLGLAGAFWLASRSLPDYNATHALEGLDGPVEVVRDNANVPHVFAENDDDAMFALGFVHAQDRLWQMVMMRRTVQGRLSEVFGPRTLPIDELLRRLDLYGAARDSVAALAPETRAALEAYSAGVNAWLQTVNEQALGRGAPEFFLFSSAISPWQPADSVALMKLLALQMSRQLDQEILQARLSLLLPAERVRDLLPEIPGSGIAALPEYAALFPELPHQAALRDLPRAPPDPLSPLRGRELAGASNAWAAAPSRTASGATLLANDPHLEFTAPALWYLARLELQTGGVIGGTIPGIPAILVGRSDVLGWGLTAAYMDDQDLFIEKLNPDNPDEVLTPEGYRPLKSRPSIIRVKGQAPRTITLQWSENGPILPAGQSGLSAITPPGHVVALGWSALERADTTLDAAMGLMRAGSVAQAIEAARSFVAPAQNLILADRSTIAMKTIGRMPRRDIRHQSRGRMPAPGWIAANRWQGSFDYDANPEFVAPAGGIVGNTNNKMVDRPFPRHVSYSWGDSQRIRRWSGLMQNREIHTRESFIEAQLDTVSITARTLLPLVARDLWFTGEPAPEGSPARQRQRALELLAEWNGEMNEHMPEPLIYATWMRALQERLIRDELGPLAREFTHVEPLFIERVFRDIGGAAAWCDVIRSAPVESCTDIARLALDDALLWIGENFGGTLESLRWGDAHVATQDHPVLGRLPLLKYLVNIRQSTSGGDNTLMRGRTSGRNPEPFLNVHGAGYRGIYDFADVDSSLFIISTGQSGHPLSRFYDDLSALWQRGEYLPMSLDPALARAAAVGITRLTPRR